MRGISGLLPVVLLICGACSDDGGGETNGNNNNAQSQCGNGVVEGLEECDEGSLNSDTEPDACRTDCREPRCGDGALDAGEECDEGQRNSDALSDACRTSCLLPSCGDGTVDIGQGETCDLGPDIPGDHCGPTCKLIFCGNGVLEGDEACDDGNLLAGDGCSPDCRSNETCGNGITDFGTGEQCDCGTDPASLPTGCPGVNGSGGEGSCRVDCRVARCGNGLLDPGEICDDGNTLPGDGCSADCRSDETCGNGYTDYALGEQCDDGNLRSRDGCSSGCTVELPVWELWAPPPSIRRTSPALAFDSHRQALVLFGGLGDEGQLLSDTSELVAGAWRPVQTPTSPPGGPKGEMIFDSHRNRIVLVTGGGSGQECETWEHDGVQWVNRSPAGSPPTREKFALAYDPGRHRVVLFGGWTSTNPMSQDTWEYDGNAWVQISATGLITGRYGHAMTYDPAAQRVVLFGGCCQGTLFDLSTFDDTWAWNGSQWQELSGSIRPPSRLDHRLAHDAARERVVMYGGVHIEPINPEELLDDTWELVGSTWTEAAPSLTPPPLEKFAMAYDGTREHVVLHGGDSYMATELDTWEFTGTAWARIPSATSPPARTHAALAHDSLRGVSILYGGSPLGGTPDESTWEFDGVCWMGQELSPNPGGLFNHGMAFDSARGLVVLFGGDSEYFGVTNQTWEYDGASWTRRFPQGAPQIRQGHAMAYDPLRQRVVLFGGVVGSDFPFTMTDDTWEYDGAQWVDVSPAVSPPPGSGYQMTFDTARNRIVLYDQGYSSLQASHLWTYDGATWTPEPEDPAGPDDPGTLALTYDAGMGALLLFGGQANTNPLNETWEIRNGLWKEILPILSPPPRSGHDMVFDPRRRVALLFGGDLEAQTWLFSYRSTHPEELCNTDVDTDGDGLEGCGDPDCYFHPRCQPVELCTGGQDEDGDGAIDCADSSCGGAPCSATGNFCIAGQCRCPGGASETNCGNGVDDDCDGLVDCADPADCSASPLCEYPETTCDDGRDNDGDDLADCADPNCNQAAFCQAGGSCQPALSLTCGASHSGSTAGVSAIDEYLCLGTDITGPEAFYRFEATTSSQVEVSLYGLQVDLDLVLLGAFPSGACDPIGGCLMRSAYGGAMQEFISFVAHPGETYFVIVDSKYGAFGDYQLSLSCPSCQVAETSCGDGRDEDCDGDVDCADPDCNGVNTCELPEVSCNDHLDNDGDGWTDCDDPDCSIGPEADCGDGLDDNCDGLVDCADPDCSAQYPCEYPETTCSDGIDNDGDGGVDCEDLNCATSAFCNAGGLCQPLTDVSCGSNLSGNTTGGPENFLTYSCVGWEESGPESFYRFSTPTASMVTVTLSGMTADLDLFLLGPGVGGACDAELHCLGESSTPNPVESISFSASAGEPYFLVVEGFENAAGSFNLAVTCN